MIVKILMLFILTSSSLAANDHNEETMLRPKRGVIRNDSCPRVFGGRCHCRPQPYPHRQSPEQYVVNCTNSRFTDTDMLRELPDETEVLIFTGNMLNELEDNIFGFDFKHQKLNYIDFSNNHITFIKGQTFHHVNNVETLILSFNDIEITDRFERHRILSNFRNLRFLHLTDSFTDRYNASSYYLLTLEDIFIESNLSKVERIHLEQNEISSIGDNKKIFCSLKSLKHLYLSDNKLGDLDFNIDCLKNLSHVDIRYNSLTRLSSDAMSRLDKFVSTARPLSLNLMDNPLACDCRSKEFLTWLTYTAVKIDSFDDYVCRDGFPEENVGRNINEVTTLSCPGAYSSHTVAGLSFMVAILVVSVVFLVIYHKQKLTTLVQPLVNDLTRKMGYKGLANEETVTEVNV